VTFVKVRPTAHNLVLIPTILNFNIGKVTGHCHSRSKSQKQTEQSKAPTSFLHHGRRRSVDIRRVQRLLRLHSTSTARRIFYNILFIMSADDTKSADEVCASCGIAGLDNVKLKKCACNLVKYCSVDCQKNDRSRHKKECKKRLAEMHNRKLFEQPDSSHLGECPICCLPFSLDPTKSTLMSCCSKIICNGCSYANTKREFLGGLQHRCAFCREPAPERDDEEGDRRVMERIKKNDPVAMAQMAKRHEKGGDFGKALEYYTKATELGDMTAHFGLGAMYYNGEGVEEDKKKGIHHLEQAAIGGHPGARSILGFYDMENGRMERAVKHLIIASNLGCHFSLTRIKDLFVKGIVSKEDYAAALRAYQAAVDATKSAEREAAEFSRS
jgi:hypothetical protein